jgi:putative glutamine amidotransferase
MRLVSALYEDFGPFLNVNGVTHGDTATHVDELRDDDILLLHGGEDISPSLYNHAKHPYTTAGVALSRRDRIEWALLQRAIQLKIPVLGICRGAQLLCAAAGGYLIQHVENHGGTHLVITIDGDEVSTNSCHHQMQYPFDVEHEMLMWIENKRSPVHFVGDGRSVTNDLLVEPEAVYYPAVKGFAPQWHPEWLDDNHPANKKLIRYINERI